MNQTAVFSLVALSLLIAGCSPADRDSTTEPEPGASTAADTTGTATESTAEDTSSAVAEDTKLYWGDTHLHTSYSFDAFTLGNRTADPDTAYRFAKGMPVVHPGHRALVRIDRPLDFLVVTDHAEFLGVVPEIAAGNPLLLSSELGQMWHEMLTTPGRENDFFNDLVERGTVDPSSIAFLSDEGIVRTVWSKVVDAAERHNNPGTFTAFIGWEWSSAPGGLNLHRIVFTPDGKDKALQYLPYSLLESEKPRDLWRFLERTAEKVGTDFVAIGHNPNLSNGRFFPLEDEYGKAVDADYAQVRRRWEPVVEVTQYKGDSETHPILAPSDEFADFERYKHTLDGAPLVHEDRKLRAIRAPSGSAPGGRDRRKSLQVRDGRSDRLSHGLVCGRGGELPGEICAGQYPGE